MALSDRSPSVFLSYARRQPDENWAARISETLRQRYDVHVVFDKRHISPGRDFDSEIKALIRASDALIFIGSTSSVTSEPCQDECVYARDQGKPIIPLFIEDVSWGDFPADFHSLHFEQLHRADSENQFAAMIGKGLIAAGRLIDPATVPEPETEFDVWAGYIYPPYEKIRHAHADTLREYVDACSHRLKLNIKKGFHNLNLALLFLRLGDHRRAADYADIAVGDLPGRADAHYFRALIAAAASPLASMSHGRAERVIRSLDNSIRLGIESTPKSRSTGAALPWLLKAIVAHDYYARNGLIPIAGEPEMLLQETLLRQADAQELDRLGDTLLGLSIWSVRAIEACRGRGYGDGPIKQELPEVR
jgi:hypothetical protein